MWGLQRRGGLEGLPLHLLWILRDQIWEKRDCTFSLIGPPWPVFSGSRPLWAGIAADWDEHDGTTWRPPPGFRSSARAEVSHSLILPRRRLETAGPWEVLAALNGVVWVEGGQWFKKCMKTGVWGYLVWRRDMWPSEVPASGWKVHRELPVQIWLGRPWSSEPEAGVEVQGAGSIHDELFWDCPDWHEISTP